VLLRRPGRVAPPRGLDLAAAVAFLALLGVAAAPLAIGEALDRYATLVELVKLVGLAGFCIAAYGVASDETEGERLFTWILVAGAIYAVWAAVVFFRAPHFVLGLEKQMHVERLTGSFLSANTAGSLFGALACALAVRLFRRIGRKLGSRRSREAEDDMARWGTELRDAALLAVLWIALLLTVSRAALVVSLAVVAAFAVIELLRYAHRRRLKARSVAIAGGAVATAFAVLLAGSLSSQLQGQFGRLGADAISRTAILDEYLPGLAAVPLTGYGLGAFPAINAERLTAENFDRLWSLGAAHNVVLQWWLEAGPVGLAVAALLVGLILLRLVLRMTNGRVGRWRAGAALAVSAVLLLHNGVDYSLETQAVAAFWALMLGLGLGERRRTDGPNAPSAPRLEPRG
jgi:O-antigen ligase